MIVESGRVLEVEGDYVWVATIQTSTCNNCRAQAGCGQGLLAKLGGNETLLKVALKGFPGEMISLNDRVTLGISENAVVKASLLAYILPLVLMLGMVVLADHFLATQFGEMVVIAAAVAGLGLGALCIRAFGRRQRYQEEYEPVLLDHHLAVAA